MVNKWLKIVQELLARCLSLPCHCVLCLLPSKRGIALCQRCEQQLPWLRHTCRYCALPLDSSMTHFQQLCGQCVYQVPVYDALQALFEYQWPLQQFVSHLKFGGHLHYANMLGSLMSTHLTPRTCVDTIVAMPLHPKRQQARGFNQALEIAKIIAKKQKIPLDILSCHRIKYTSAQTTLSAKKRSENIHESAFVISPKIRSRHILVIDDVVTTGATVTAFSKALKIAGVETVEIWASCRTGLHR